MHMSSNIKGIFFAALGFSFFAYGDVIFKYLGDYYSIFTTTAFSSLFASIALLIAAKMTGGIRRAFQTNKLKLHLLRGVIITSQLLLAIYAITHLSLAKTYALVFIAPFIATMLSIPMLKESVSPRHWIAIALGFIGILIVLRPGMIPIETAALAALGSAVFFALSNVLVRIIGTTGETKLSFPLYTEVVLIPVTFTLALIWDTTWPSLPHMALLALNGALGACGMYFITRGFSTAAAAIVAPFHYIQMLWAILFGYIIFNDRPDIWIGLGAAIIIASGVWLIRHEHSRDYLPPQTPPVHKED